jgi:hypothetical protein
MMAISGSSRVLARIAVRLEAIRSEIEVMPVSYRVSGLEVDPYRVSGLEVDPYRVSGLEVDPYRVSGLEVGPYRVSSSA